MGRQEFEPKDPQIEKLPFSPLPQIEILGITTVPDGAETAGIASSPTAFAGESARTCYSGKGLYRPQDYLDPKHQPVTDQVIESTRKAGHLTTRQHFEIVFGLTNVSRQVLWAFFHIHPFYNSEQVSQRYVAVKEGNFFIPPLEGQALELYLRNAQEQMAAYQQLKEALEPAVAEEYLRIFPARRSERWQKANAGVVEKKAQEVARYVLGVDTFSYLYHTVSALTLMRYFRTCSMADVPLEARLIVYEMVNQVAKFDPNFFKELEDPYPLDQTPEFQVLTSLRQPIDYRVAKAFNQEFDHKLGGINSKLVDWSVNAPQTLASAVRNVLGIDSSRLSDAEAIELVLNPAKNKVLGDVLNLTTLHKLSQALHSISYTFEKKISHTADSQDQRHRMTPAARPIIATQFTGEPDYITPALISYASLSGSALYETIMERTFDTINKLLKLGVPPEFALYRLPNAFPIRFTESSDLLNLHHKYRMRLCFNAQEEIWETSVRETRQISQVHPQIGKWLLAPCGIRWSAHNTPFCPEGERYCGKPLWDKRTEEYPPRLI